MHCPKSEICRQLYLAYYCLEPQGETWEELYLKIQSVPLCKHTSIIEASHLMLYREIIAVFSEIHIKPINTPCEQNLEFVNVKPGGTYSNQWALKR